MSGFHSQAKAACLKFLHSQDRSHASSFFLFVGRRQTSSASGVVWWFGLVWWFGHWVLPSPFGNNCGSTPEPPIHITNEGEDRIEATAILAYPSCMYASTCAYKVCVRSAPSRCKAMMQPPHAAPSQSATLLLVGLGKSRTTC